MSTCVKYKETEIFFPAFLPRFDGIGHHQGAQYTINNPPPGYKYTTHTNGTTFDKTRILSSIGKLMVNAVKYGAKPEEVSDFIKTRDLKSQLLYPSDAELVFLPTWPYTVGQVPWIVHIEEILTLFSPFDGADPRLLGPHKFYDTPYFPCVKALLESKTCKGIVCHVKSAADSIPSLFENPSLINKVFHIPMGIPAKETPTSLLYKKTDKKDFVQILFTNSWHQDPKSFYLRGGLDLLEAFSKLISKYPNIRLILRTKLPVEIQEAYSCTLNSSNVKVLDHMLSFQEMKNIRIASDIYALPSAGLHVYSTLDAMSAGMALIVSDGYGIQEYIKDRWNGIVVKGRNGKVSWVDENGIKREDFRPMFEVDPYVVNQLIVAISELIDNKELRFELARNAIYDVENKFSIYNWNNSLKQIFDHALDENK